MNTCSSVSCTCLFQSTPSPATSGSFQGPKTKVSVRWLWSVLGKLSWAAESDLVYLAEKQVHGPDQRGRDATHNLFKYLHPFIFYKQKQEITVIRLNLDLVCSNRGLKKKSSTFPVVAWIWVFLESGSLRWVTWDKEEGSFTLHTALPERKLRGWRELFSSVPLKHFFCTWLIYEWFSPNISICYLPPLKAGRALGPSAADCPSHNIGIQPHQVKVGNSALTPEGVCHLGEAISSDSPEQLSWVFPWAVIRAGDKAEEQMSSLGGAFDLGGQQLK